MAKIKDAKGRTTLEWKVYKKKAQEIIAGIPESQRNWQKTVIDRLGIPYFPVDGKKVEFGLNTRNNLRKKQSTVRTKNMADVQANRTGSLNNANDLIDHQKLKEGLVKKANIQSKPARNADHIWEVQEFGPTLKQLEKEYAAGAISKAEYDKRMKIFIDQNPGDHVDNLQDLHFAQNNKKKDIVDMKNKTLQAMEEGNPSLRHLDPKYKRAMELAEGYDITKVAKLSKRALKYVPIVGSGIVALNFKATAQEAIDDPTWQNKTQAAIAGADTALEGFELATGGAGGILTTPLQLGLMVADQLIHQTEDDFQRSTYDWSERRAARHGNR